MTFSQEFLDLLRHPSAPRFFLFEGEGRNRDTGDVETLRFGSRGYTTEPGDTPANTPYLEGLVNPGTFRRSMYAANREIAGVFMPDAGTIEIENTGGVHDHLRRYDFDGRDWRVLMGGWDPESGGIATRPWSYDRFQEIGRGPFKGHLHGIDRVTFETRDLRYRLEQRNLQEEYYAGMGACVEGNGVDRSVSFGDIHDFTATQSFTIELRFRGAPLLSQTHMLLSKKSVNNATDAGWGARISSSDAWRFVRWDLADGTDLVVAQSPSDRIIDDAWHHGALVVNRTLQTATAYLDGVAGTPVDITSVGSLANAQNLYALRNGAGTAWGELQVDEIRVWTIARTGDDIKGAMSKTLAGSETGLADYWKLDEWTGTTAASSVTGGNSGTLSSSSMWATTHEGYDDLAGKPKPVAEGPCDNVTGMLIDHKDGFGVYQFHGGPIKAVRAVYFGGVLKTLTTDYTVDLRNGAIEVQGAAPAGLVTADIDGDAFGGYITAAPDILRRVATGYRPMLGDALTFDGAATWVNFGDNFDQTTTFTIEMWIRADSTTAGRWLFQKWSGSDGLGASLDPGTGKLRFLTSDLSNVTLDTAAAVIRQGRLHHVAFVWDDTANTKTIYVDGVQAAQATAVTGTLVAHSTNLTLGANSSGTGAFFAGDIDEFRIWSTARTQPEIEASRHGQLVGTESGLTAYWQLNGDATNTTGGVDGTVTLGAGAWVSSSDPLLPVNEASFAALLAKQSASVNHYWSEPINRLDAAAEVAIGIDAYVVTNRAGELYVGRTDLPTGPKLGAYALSFDGTDGYVSVPAGVNAGSTGGRWTFGAWIYPRRVAGSSIIAMKRDPAGLGFELRLESGSIVFYCFDAAGTGAISVSSNSVLVENEWRHVSVSCADNDTLRIVIDGVQDETIGSSPGIGEASTVTALLIGGDTSGLRGFNGVIDEPMYWSNVRHSSNVLLTKDNEINDPIDYEETNINGNFLMRILGYWRLNDGTGTTADDEIGSNDGTLVGGVTWTDVQKATIHTGDIIAIEPLPVDVPSWRQTCAYAWNYTVQNGDAISTSVSAMRRAYLAESYRLGTPFPEPGVLDAHLLALDALPVESHFTSKADADAESTRLQLFDGSDLESYKVLVAGLGFQVEIGDTLTLVYERLDMDEGEPVLVLGVEDLPLAGGCAIDVLRVG